MSVTIDNPVASQSVGSSYTISGTVTAGETAVQLFVRFASGFSRLIRPEIIVAGGNWTATFTPPMAQATVTYFVRDKAVPATTAESAATDWTSASTSVPIVPGLDWSPPPSEPAAVGAAGEWGQSRYPIAKFTDPVQHQACSTTKNVGVAAWHIRGINRVEFAVDDGAWVSRTTKGINPETGRSEYWVYLDAADFGANDLCKVYARVYPNVGRPRLLGPLEVRMNPAAIGSPATIYVKSDGNDANDGLTAGAPKGPILDTATGAFATVGDGGTIICVDGSLTAYKIGTAGAAARTNVRYITIRPANGIANSDITLNSPSAGASIQPWVKYLRVQVGVNYGSFTTTGQWTPQPGHHLWLDWGVVTDNRTGGWTNFPTLSPVVKWGPPTFTGSSESFSYATRSVAYDANYGFSFMDHIHACHPQKISGSPITMSSAYTTGIVSGCTISRFNSDAGNDYHRDITHPFSENDDYNLAYEGITAPNYVKIETSIFQHGFFVGGNIAYDGVDITVDKVANTAAEDNWGGPQYSDWTGLQTHLLIKDCNLSRQRLTPSLAAWAKDVLFDTADLHWSTYDSWITKKENACGVTFRNCTNTVRAMSTTTDLAAGVAGTTVSLTWTIPWAAANDNRLYRSADGGLTWTLIGSAGGQAYLSQTDTMAADATHLYYLELQDASTGLRKLSNVLIKGVLASLALTAPANLAAGAGDTVVNLTWDANAAGQNVRRYRVCRASAIDGLYAYIATASTNSYQNTGLTNGTTYYYRITAVQGDGPESEPSTAAAGVPAAVTASAIGRMRASRRVMVMS